MVLFPVMEMLRDIVQIDDEGRLFLSAAIEDWQPILDGELPDLDRLHAVAKLGADLIRRGDRVLAHCGMGLNRSALMAALILRYLGMDGEAAVARCRERR